MIKLNKQQLKRKLDYHYRAFDKSRISPDPIEFPHRYSNFYDIEISAFLSSIFAYGRIEQIQKSLILLHDLMENQPYDFIKNYSFADGIKLFENFVHRFYKPEDVAQLFHILRIVYDNYESLNKLFLLYYFAEDKNLKNAISFFSNNLKSLLRTKQGISSGLKFMFPDPIRGSACKRMNLFMRWMVRKDEIDFGLWKEIPPNKLVIPVDTHIAKICKELKLTKSKNVSWKMAEEITNNLAKFNSKDPVKYDFALCHIGMRNMKF